MMRRLIKRAGRCVGLDRLLWAIHRLLADSPASPGVPNVSEGRIFGHFTDSHGDQIELIEGCRARVRPGWEKMLNPPDTIPLPTQKEITDKLARWREILKGVEVSLHTFGGTLQGKEILEIGAFDGAAAYALAQAGAARVSATDMAAYYITQAPDGEVSQETKDAKNRDLARVREAYASALDRAAAQRVVFHEDDICASRMEPESHDLIVSWEVLEHITRPDRAFAEMARILRPGGLAFHEYNPFFCLTGGHSLCTLDFPWGHARLSDADFERYLDEVRPDEKKVALSFYHNNLNRMSLADLHRHAREAKLGVRTVLPFPLREQLPLVSRGALEQCQQAYPGIELLDLVSPSVWVVLEK